MLIALGFHGRQRGQLKPEGDLKRIARDIWKRELSLYFIYI